MSTQKAKKLPDNANELCELSFLRAVFAIKLHNIPDALIVNADQTGIILLPTGRRTYELKGSKDVSVSNHEEKRQVSTLYVIA